MLALSGRAVVAKVTIYSFELIARVRQLLGQWSAATEELARDWVHPTVGDTRTN